MMTILIKYWKPLAILALVIVIFMAGYLARQDQVNDLTKQVQSLEAINQAQARQIAAERAAVKERAERLKTSEAGHEKLAKELDEACDLRSDWTVPDALYERLRQSPYCQ
jgi:type II secretory pathway pseudopilin PulG